MQGDSSETTTNVTKMPLAAVAAACQQRTQQQAREGIDYCFELFRRAFDDDDQAAWEAIRQQYFRLICSWIQQFRPTATSDEVDTVAWEVIARFWRTLSGKGVAIGDRFTLTSQLMVYLKRCAFTVVQDRQRKVQKQQEVIEELTVAQSHVVRHVEETIQEQFSKQQDHEKLRQWILRYVTDSAELHILALTFEQGLTPRQIVAAHPDQFPDTRSVRRVKERLLKRARRYWDH